MGVIGRLFTEVIPPITNCLQGVNHNAQYLRVIDNIRWLRHQGHAGVYSENRPKSGWWLELKMVEKLKTGFDRLQIYVQTPALSDPCRFLQLLYRLHHYHL